MDQSSPTDFPNFTAANDAAPQVSSNTEPFGAPFGHPNPDPGAAYRATFTEEIKTAIVTSVSRAYEIVQERHEPDLGYNQHTFGHNVYHVGKFQLGQCCENSGGKLARVEDLKTLFRFQGGAYTLGFYKVGHSADTNIWEAFPTSENGATSVNQEGQPVLSGLEDAMMDRVDNLQYVVVAHLGNPSHGLCAVYLCIPVRTEGGKIKRWGYAEAIYMAPKGSRSFVPPVPPVLPPENTIGSVVPEEVPAADIIVTVKELG